MQSHDVYGLKGFNRNTRGGGGGGAVADMDNTLMELLGRFMSTNFEQLPVDSHTRRSTCSSTCLFI